MQSNEQEQLEESLKGLSWWSGPTPGVWRKALAGGASSRIHDVLRSRWPWVAGPIAAVIVVAIGASFVEHRGGFRPDRFKISAVQVPVASQLAKDELDFEASAGAGFFGYAAKAPADSPSEGDGDTTTEGVKFGQELDAERHVVLKASMDLETDDVRGVYLKIQKMLLHEVEGEYVEQAQLHGNGAAMAAYVTLRVRSGRMSEVLGALRELGSVMHEQSEAIDVTSQVVDVEARLRNERRVEEELLALLDKRKDSPLEDVLKVSEALAGVRGRIEKLVAERRRVGRQVALGTIVVSIHQGGTGRPSGGLWGQLRGDLSSAWRDGTSFLVSTLAGVVRVAIGGLIWWVLLCVALWWGRRCYLRRVGAGSVGED